VKVERYLLEWGKRGQLESKKKCFKKNPLKNEAKKNGII